MSLTVTNIGDNQQAPSITADAYIPDQLIAGDLKLVTDSATITGGADLLRGSLLGQVTLGAVTAAARTGGNTGNGACVPDVTTPLLANAKVGVYQLVCTVAGANSATFRLYDPKGLVVKDFSFDGSGASFTTDDELKLAVTDGGTDFVVGDAFNVTVAQGSLSYKLSATASVDGSQYPNAVLADSALCSTNGADQVSGVYRMGEFNANAMTFGTGWTAASALAALAALPIYLKNVGVLDLTYTDPT